MLSSVRRWVVDHVAKGGILYRILRASFLPASITIGTIYRLLTRRFTKPGVVIGGSGRSGTSLLLSILSAHPQLFAVDHETPAFVTSDFHQRPDSPDNFKLYRLYTPLALAHIPPSTTRWVEKTPSNVHFFGPILAYFGEDIRIIHLVRDGRDVITSRHPNKPGEFYFSTEKWVGAVCDGMRWESDPRVIRVRYEDLVTNFEPTVRRICKFLAIPCDDKILTWHEHTAWEGEVRRLHRESVGRWESEEFEDRVHELMKNHDAVRLLGKYGYPVSKARR